MVKLEVPREQSGDFLDDFSPYLEHKYPSFKSRLPDTCNKTRVNCEAAIFSRLLE